MKKLAAVLALTASVASAEDIHSRVVRRYVSDRLPEIMRAQRAKFGMKFPDYPKIAYVDIVDPAWPPGWVNTGRYNDAKDTIEVHRWFLERPGFFSIDQLDHLLVHEPVHFYFDKAVREPEKLSSAAFLQNNVVEEGIAVHVTAEITGKKPEKKCRSKVNIDEYGTNNQLRYDIGYCIAEPVVRRYGLEGMKYLVRNPPTLAELEKPLVYRDKILSELSLQ